MGMQLSSIVENQDGVSKMVKIRNIHTLFEGMSRKSVSNADDTSNEIMMVSNEANLNSTSNIGMENQNMEALEISPSGSADQSMSFTSNQYHSMHH
tara:strand:- start:447 stop:734 length:288 start_codon:yes stop_codon:yes gene_type:complete